LGTAPEDETSARPAPQTSGLPAIPSTEAAAAVKIGGVAGTTA
jgi:hypothetical protein